MDASYFDLQGSVALVTGASSGLGQHFARVLARAGCAVGLAARREHRLESLAREIEQAGGQAVSLVVDVSDVDSVEQGLEHLTDTCGVPTILINNAGLAAHHSFLDAPDEETSSVFSVNQLGVWQVARCFARRLVATGAGGSIVNIASIAGLRATGGTASYAVSKAAVAHMTQVLALELARYGIRVNAIAPGYFETELNTDFLHSDSGRKLIGRIPLRRTGELEELDGILMLLSSTRASFMTGTVIPVDGGHLVSSL